MNKTSYIFVFFLFLVSNTVAAVTVDYGVYDNETSEPLPFAIITLTTIGFPFWSQTSITDPTGHTDFLGVPDNRFFTSLISREGYKPYSNGSLYVSGDTSFTALMDKLEGDEWEDLLIDDGNLRIVWHSNDLDNFYFPGERMNHEITVTNIMTSGQIRFDENTSLWRRMFRADGTPTDWNSFHRPDPGDFVILKSDGGWFTNSFNGNVFEICTGESIIKFGDIEVDLNGGDFVCFEETRNDNVVPNMTGDFYIDIEGTYKISDVLHTITGQTGDFTIFESTSPENHPPTLNTIHGAFGIEGEQIRIEAIAYDEDLDDLTFSINDSRFVYSRNYGFLNAAFFDWQTSQGDAGIIQVEITASDEEFSVTEKGNVTVMKRFEISLGVGYNLISIPVTPIQEDYYGNPTFNNSVRFIFKDMLDSFKTIFAYDSTISEWISFSPEKPDFLNTLNNIDLNQGIWINVNKTTTLIIKGLAEYPVSYNMVEGRNLIGFPADTEISPEDALAGVYGTYQIIFGYDPVGGWTSYNPDRPPFLNTLDFMIPGHGYSVTGLQDSIWIFDGTSFTQG